MKGRCCRTCHPNSIAACRKCSAERGPDVGHRAVVLGSGARAFGMSGRALTTQGGADTTIVVMWVQNINNTFSQQDATKPASSRPPLLAIRDLQIDLDTIPLPSQMLGLVGRFSVTFTDTHSGAVSANVQNLLCPKDCRVLVPTFTTDIAITVRATR